MVPRFGVTAWAWLCGTPEGNTGSNLCELHLPHARLPGRGVGTISPVCQPCMVGRETPLLRVLGSLRSSGSSCPCLLATSLFTNLSTAIACLHLCFSNNLFRWLAFFVFRYLRSLSVPCHLCPVFLAVPLSLSLVWLWPPPFHSQTLSTPPHPLFSFFLFSKPELASILKSIND